MTHVEVFQPASIEETVIAIRISTVQERGSGIDDATRYIFGGSLRVQLPCIVCRRIGLLFKRLWEVIVGHGEDGSSKKPSAQVVGYTDIDAKKRRKSAGCGASCHAGVTRRISRPTIIP